MAFFPEGIRAAAGMNAAEGKNAFGPALAPEHAGLLAARTNDGFAARFDDARPDEQALFTKGAVCMRLTFVSM